MILQQSTSPPIRAPSSPILTSQSRLHPQSQTQTRHLFPARRAANAGDVLPNPHFSMSSLGNCAEHLGLGCFRGVCRAPDLGWVGDWEFCVTREVRRFHLLLRWK